MDEEQRVEERLRKPSPVGRHSATFVWMLRRVVARQPSEQGEVELNCMATMTGVNRGSSQMTTAIIICRYVVWGEALFLI